MLIGVNVVGSALIGVVMGSALIGISAVGSALIGVVVGSVLIGVSVVVGSALMGLCNVTVAPHR